MTDYEKLGVFYLGRPYDLAARKPQEGLFLYDSKDLVTHGVCVGMTGSGKTGLCVSLLEEAALDGIPAIAIDPKGDLTNLLLTFPGLKPEDFRPWVNAEDAQKKGLTVEEYAAKQADLWKNGLASWGQSGERIARLRTAAEFLVYTPGSTAGVPVSILKSFAAPPRPILDEPELLRERINITATSLLGIIGITADPIKSREHILISAILGKAWQEGKDMDLAALIQQVQSPQFSRIGVLDVDTFYPEKDRFELTMSLNNLLAAPGFNAWLEGDSLDISSILYDPGGKPRVAIFYLAHLSDAERMFFVSLLLNQVLGWMRSQSGTTSLRSILYMDEIFGFFPPVANPPSKLPLLTLLKQARAFGLGVLLATQNPVDLDYKGLSNAGTWFIGRLQTERDKARVLEGLEGVAATAGADWDRGEMEQTLAALGNRVFLVNNVHEDAPLVFETRWAMSYLRGPLTRDQVKVLMDPIKARRAVPRPSISSQPEAAGGVAIGELRPTLPPGIPQQFIPWRGNKPPDQTMVYMPELIGAAHIQFADIKAGVSQVRDVAFRAPFMEGPISVNWDKAEEAGFNITEMEQTPAEVAAYGSLPATAARSESYRIWSKEFTSWLYRNQNMTLFKSPSMNEYSRPGETERDFRVRLQFEAREKRDNAIEKLRQKYTPKIAKLQEQLRRAQASIEREKEQANQQKMQTALSFGTTLLGGLMGRRISRTSLGGARSTLGGVSRSWKESKDIDRAKDTMAAVQQQLKSMEMELQAETAALSSRLDPLAETLERVTVRPAKTAISIQLVTLGWLPYWKGQAGKLTPAW